MDIIVRKRKLSRKLDKMVAHLHSSSFFDFSRQVIQLTKIEKTRTWLDSLSGKRLIVQHAGLILCELRFIQHVKENGFSNIFETLDELGLREVFDNCSPNEKKNTFSAVSSSGFVKNFIDIFLPIQCEIRIGALGAQTENIENYIDCTKVRPPLPGDTGRLQGLVVNFQNKKFLLRVFCIINSDPLRHYRSKIRKQIILEDIHDRYGAYISDAAPKYLDTISLRDYVTLEYKQISNKIKKNIDKIEHYRKSFLSDAIIAAEYQFLSIEERVDQINLLLHFDMISFVCKMITVTDYEKIKNKLDHESQIKMNSILSTESTMFRNRVTLLERDHGEATEVPYETQINSMNCSEKIKNKAREKLKIITKSSDSCPKEEKYLEGLLKIPFGKYRNEVVCKREGETDDSFQERQMQWITHAKYTLDQSVHGHTLLKTKFERLLAKWANAGQSGCVIGIQGPPGNGKTTIVRNGLSKCLADENNCERPLGFIPLGGSAGASTLVGHGFTYVGSTYGRIVDILHDAQCMNPILVFDELDKVSATDHGREIISVLTHLTDSSQNTEFNDRYFDGIPIDLSKCIIVFTFNDASVIDPILMDRMTVIHSNPLKLKDKLIVAREHLLPQICNDLGIDTADVEISDDTICEIVESFTCESGARQLKRILDDAVQELNLRKLTGTDTEMVIDEELILSVMSHVDKPRRDSIDPDDRVGQMVGLWANALGLGGILKIQVHETGAKELLLTGNQGDVMIESMKCAKTIAYSLAGLTSESEYGIHIHCPSAGTPKDGPSAGAAICCAIYSLLTGQRIKNDVAMTGELDLQGNVTAIGGLSAKLRGAKAAGIKNVLIPAENHLQLVRVRKEDPELFQDARFIVIEIETINEAIQHVF